MSYRAIPANALIGVGRSLGRALGCELSVEVSDHSINAKMAVPETDTKAWDDNLYRRGNLFHSEYSNPIKPTVQYNKDLENPDEIDHKEGNPEEQEDVEDDETDADGPHVQLISSSRYQDYMRQDLVSQLLTPEEQWRKILYVVLALAFMGLSNIFISMSAAGFL
jgi:hypothetical protein